jgi:hypothetical protein
MMLMIKERLGRWCIQSLRERREPEGRQRDSLECGLDAVELKYLRRRLACSAAVNQVYLPGARCWQVTEENGHWHGDKERSPSAVVPGMSA